jgi:hypothetical protein
MWRLPARRHVACRYDPETGSGVFLVEHPAKPLAGAKGVDPMRLVSFVRLLHAFGFRFGRCDDDVLAILPAELGPVGLRHGSGCVLEDVTAVVFDPESDPSASVAVVGAWLRSRQGDKAATRFASLALRPLRLRL